MKITFTVNGKPHAASPPAPDASYVEVSGWTCACGSHRVAGRGRSIESRDTYRADADCIMCGRAAGVLRVKVSTIFGLEEDERVCNMGYTVY